MALDHWDNEGGAAAHGARRDAVVSDVLGREPALTNTELVQLRVRVIALENLLLAFLAQASKGQLAVARERAAYISPRAGSVRHPLTLRAAAQMVHLVGHAGLLSARARAEADMMSGDTNGYEPAWHPSRRTTTNPKER